MSIIVNNSIIFLDSLQFCKVSLDSLAGNLEDNDFKHLLSEFPKDKLELLRKKDATHMSGLIFLENLVIQDYHQKKPFIHHLMMGKEVKVMDMFLMFGIHLILKHLEIFIIIT